MAPINVAEILNDLGSYDVICGLCWQIAFLSPYGVHQYRGCVFLKVSFSEYFIFINNELIQSPDKTAQT
jgi:hypothetical protein